MKKKLTLSILLSVGSNTSFALDSFVGKVTSVEPTYLPTAVTFVMDTGNSTCPAGTWLRWQKADPENNKAVYASLLTALSTGKQVRFHFNNGDSACLGQYLHILN